MTVNQLESRANRSLPRGRRAVLHLDGEPVGAVTISGWDGSWGYGSFMPGERFSAYAPLFGIWSLLMHAEGADRLSSAASEELSQAETRLDAIKSQLFFPKTQEWVDVAELNIDGDLLEWKEY